MSYALREELYAQFGPHIIEAVLETFLDELNEVRTQAGLKRKSKKDLETAAIAKLSSKSEFDFVRQSLSAETGAVKNGK